MTTDRKVQFGQQNSCTNEVNAFLRDKKHKGNAVITYKKSQVLYALWNTLRNPANYEKKPSPIFARRLDKLQSVNVPLLPEERNGQAGYDNEFTEPQGFLIARALILMESGFGLGTAGFFIHHARNSPLYQYGQIRINRRSPVM